MKKQLLIAIILSASMSLWGQGIFGVCTGAQTSYMNEAFGESWGTNWAADNVSWDYFNPSGIETVATNGLAALKTTNNNIIMGLSLGGAVTQRMAQMASKEGVPIKGYITVSAPLQGDRLTDPVWAVASTATLGAHLLNVGSQAFITAFASYIYSNKGEETELQSIPIQEEWNDGAKKLATSINQLTATARKNHANSLEQSAKELGIPYLKAILSAPESKGGEIDYLATAISNAFLQKGTIADLNPTGNHMRNVVNKPEELNREIGYTRVFLESTNGDIFETKAWAYFQPVIGYFEGQRDYWWAKACNEWWLFPVFSLVSAGHAITVNTMYETPKVWSFCCSGDIGTSGYANHDGFVQANDSYLGNSLSMRAKNFGASNDHVIAMPAVSHVDTGTDPSTLRNSTGRSGSRAPAADQQILSYRQAYKIFQ
jgi:hypothetical protein